MKIEIDINENDLKETHLKINGIDFSFINPDFIAKLEKDIKDMECVISRHLFEDVRNKSL